MKKTIIISIISLISILSLTGCGNDNLTLGSTNRKGNCSAIECIKKINPENTVEEINKIIGFEGTLINEQYNKYYWELSEDTGVEVAYYSSSKGKITIDYDKNLLANSKVNFSRYSELKSKINEGISYNNFISYIGEVEGTIIEKSSYSTKYVWVASDGSYLTGTFSNSSGQCTFASGMIK